MNIIRSPRPTSWDGRAADVTIRPLQPQDAAEAATAGRTALTQLYPEDLLAAQEAWRVAAGTARVAHLQRTDPGGCWVAEVDGQIVGTAIGLIREWAIRVGLEAGLVIAPNGPTFVRGRADRWRPTFPAARTSEHPCGETGRCAGAGEIPMRASLQRSVRDAREVTGVRQDHYQPDHDEHRDARQECERELPGCDHHQLLSRDVIAVRLVP